MGQIVRALIEHSLTPEEILEFPKKLETCPNKELTGKWDWSSPGFDIETLLKHWNTTQADFLATHSWEDKGFPWLEKEHFTLDFFAPNLIAFDRLSS